MPEHDILIVGGGPSGLSTALHITRDFPHLTHRILILEKAHYPRPKLCAGGLVVDAEVLLQRLGLDVSEVPHVDADRICFDFEARGLSIRFPRRHALRIIRRDEFDYWLARKAKTRGIEIKEGITVKEVFAGQEGILVKTDEEDFHAQVVVGADGSNGMTRRCVFPNTPVHTARVLEVITPLLKPSEWSKKRDNAYFDFAPIPQNIAGYIWDFPTLINGEEKRCWGIYDTNILADEQRPPLKELLAREMTRFGFDLDCYEVKGYPIRWFSPQNPMSAPRVLFVGDAAGADPFLGEGISIALGYGALAAREVGQAFAKNDFSFRYYKSRILMSPLGQTLLTRWLLTHVIYPLKWKWFQILLWRILKPIVVTFARVFVVNWGKRMSSTP